MSRDTAVLGPPSAELGVQLIVENVGRCLWGDATSAPPTGGLLPEGPNHPGMWDPKIWGREGPGCLGPPDPNPISPLDLGPGANAHPLLGLPGHRGEAVGPHLQPQLPHPLLWLEGDSWGQRHSAGVTMGQPPETPQLCSISGDGGGDLLPSAKCLMGRIHGADGDCEQVGSMAWAGACGALWGREVMYVVLTCPIAITSPASPSETTWSLGTALSTLPLTF